MYKNGTVIERPSGKVISTIGGFSYLEVYIQTNVYVVNSWIEATYTVNGKSYVFYLYKNGTVISKIDNKTICTTGGEICLENYIKSITPIISVVTVNNVVYTFYVYESGRVNF